MSDGDTSIIQIGSAAGPAFVREVLNELHDGRVLKRPGHRQSLPLREPTTYFAVQVRANILKLRQFSLETSIAQWRGQLHEKLAERVKVFPPGGDVWLVDVNVTGGVDGNFITGTYEVCWTEERPRLRCMKKGVGVKRVDWYAPRCSEPAIIGPWCIHHAIEEDPRWKPVQRLFRLIGDLGALHELAEGPNSKWRPQSPVEAAAALWVAADRRSPHTNEMDDQLMDRVDEMMEVRGE